MSSIFDDAFDFTAAAEQASTERTAEARKRYEAALGILMAGIKREAMYVGKRAEINGGDEADILNAMASVYESGINPLQAAVAGNDAPAQPHEVSAPDVIDAQVAGLEEDLRRAQEGHTHLQRDYTQLEAENARNAATAQRASDYLAQLNEANRRLAEADQANARLEGDISRLNTELTEARRQRDEAQTQLTAARRNAPQAHQPAQAQQQHQEPSAPAQPADTAAPQQQGNQPRQAQAPQSPHSQRPGRQPRQEPAAPAAAPEQSSTDAPPTRVMPQSPAQPEAQQPPRRGLRDILPGHNRGRNN